jgi:hypothetical protein
VGGSRNWIIRSFPNLCTLSYINWVIKSRIMRWAGHTACMGEIRNAYNILV